MNIQEINEFVHSENPSIIAMAQIVRDYKSQTPTYWKEGYNGNLTDCTFMVQNGVISYTKIGNGFFVCRRYENIGGEHVRVTRYNGDPQLTYNYCDEPPCVYELSEGEEIQYEYKYDYNYR